MIIGTEIVKFNKELAQLGAQTIGIAIENSSVLDWYQRVKLYWFLRPTTVAISDWRGLQNSVKRGDRTLVGLLTTGSGDHRRSSSEKQERTIW
jgi:hypothetical protein